MKILVIGLDCVPPELVFDKWRGELPNLACLMGMGVYGPLESTIPPITVPAWASMVTGKDPGRLGFYGFRNRRDYSYNGFSIVTSRSLKEKAIWDYLSEAGKDVVVIGVPPSYPPKRVRGCMISCFLTPSAESPYAYPPSLTEEIEGLVGEYIFDVKNFRIDDKDNLLKQIYEMTEQRFKVVKHLLKTKPWDFFMFVEMGPDRVHHGFWKYFDPEHIKYQPGNSYENVGLEYYRFLDGKIGELLGMLDDQTAVLVVSDHGAKRMDGGICINEWLMKEGYLKLKEKPKSIARFEELQVDWENTVAWAAGGYYGRLFLNVRGREPSGVIDPENYERMRDGLIKKLEALGDENGKSIGTRVYRPQELYSEIRGIPPDLIILFGDLYWRSVGSVGWNTVWVRENDTGPDDANHALEGIFIMYDPRCSVGGRRAEGLHVMDVAPTVLNLMGLPVPKDMQGKAITTGEADS